MKNLNKNEDLWTNITVESLEQREEYACIHITCCWEICCWQIGW